MVNWVSHLSTDHVVRLGDKHFVGFLLVGAMNLQSFQTLENNISISEVLCSSRGQYRDYIINLYDVKHCTVSNFKCKMPSLSCLLSFYTIHIHPSLFNSKNFMVSLLFLCMHAYIKSSGFIGGKGPRPIKIVILPDKGRSENLDFKLTHVLIT